MDVCCEWFPWVDSGSGLPRDKCERPCPGLPGCVVDEEADDIVDVDSAIEELTTVSTMAADEVEGDVDDVAGGTM